LLHLWFRWHGYASHLLHQKRKYKTNHCFKI